jgi:Predicted ATPase (AAA+ superfamily)
MIMIPRILENSLKTHFNTGKAIIIIGPRQVGKTTLLKEITKGLDKRVLMLNCDEPDIRKALFEKTSTELKNLIGNNEVVVIDEAQRVKNIGISLKLITDEIKNIQLIVSGSSALELANEINEPLTGRKWEFMMYPISTQEMVNHHGALEEKRLLHNR